MAFNILLLVVGCIMLLKGADFFVDGTSGLARAMRIPQLIIGLTIVAMGTSMPEAAVSVSAALKANAGIAIGNIVGSNILNILIILGLSSIVATLSVTKSTVFIEIPLMIIITVLLYLEGLDGELSRLDGVILLGVFVLYILYIFALAKDNDSTAVEQSEDISKKEVLIFSVSGLALIILGSDIVVDSATDIAKTLGASDRLIGLTIVALGTSLPELFTSVSAARKGNSDIAIGNIVGSNIFNILFILGFTSLLMPIPFMEKFLFDSKVAIGAAIVLFLLSVRKKSIGKAAGIIMLAIYGVYFAFLL